MAFWIPLMMAAGAAAQGMQAQGAAEVAKLTDESNVKVQNIIRKGNNILSASRGALNRYLQSRQNQVHLKNTGKQIEAVTTNILRLQDHANSGSVQRRIAAAEEAGALAAQTGAAGVSGGTVQMLNSTLSLRHAQIDQVARTQTKQQTYDMDRERELLKEQMILGLSDVQFLDDINLMAVQPKNIQVPSTASVMINAATTFMKAYAEMGGGGGGTGTNSAVAGSQRSGYTGGQMSSWIGSRTK